MENKYTEWPSSQRLTKPDGTVAYTWDNKLHNWDGPALINKEQKIKEYYLHGIKFNIEDWKEQRRERAGLPWYKNPSLRGTSRI